MIRNKLSLRRMLSLSRYVPSYLIISIYLNVFLRIYRWSDA